MPEINVSYFTVAKDEYEGGSCPICSRCGATMRHVTVINGKHYGNSCGKKVLESMLKLEDDRMKLLNLASETLLGVVRNFESFTVEYLNRRIESCTQSGKMDYVHAWQLVLQAKNLA